MWAAATAQPDYYSTSDAAASQLHAQLPAHLPTGGGSTSSSSGGGGGGLPSLAPLYPLPSTPMPNFDMPLQGGGMRMNVGGMMMGEVEAESRGGAVAQFRPREVIPLFDIALGASAPIIPALSRPAFARDGSGRFLCGTEEQHPQRSKSNYLIFGRMDPNTGKLMTRNGSPDVWTQPISNHVRDIQWVDEQLMIVAIASTLILMRLPQHTRADLATINFPPFHKDFIREIAVSPAKRNLLLSGGFDGSVFVTDISRLCEDITTDQQHSENSIYPCGEVVGSVGWHPTNPWLASCTTDPGTLHIFDIRTDSGGVNAASDRARQSLLYNTTKPELYTHAYCDEYTILLGYGDGQIHTFDTRMQRTTQVFQDPYQRQIGEIKVDGGGVFATFGVPEVTLWKVGESRSFQVWGHNNMCPPQLPNNMSYKTSGEFLSHSSALAVTDSNGLLSYYQIPPVL